MSGDENISGFRRIPHAPRVTVPAPNTIPWHQQEIMRQVLARTKVLELLSADGNSSSQFEYDVQRTLHARISSFSKNEVRTMDFYRAMPEELQVRQVTHAISGTMMVLLGRDINSLENEGKVVEGIMIDVYMGLLKVKDDAKRIADISKKPSVFFPTGVFGTNYGGPGHVFDKTSANQCLQDHGINGLSEIDRIFIPIHSGYHYMLIVVNVQEREIVFYDSLPYNRGGPFVMQVRQWLETVEDLNETSTDASTDDFTEWNEILEPAEVPTQGNGVDCGVFVMLCADFISDNLPLLYMKEHIPIWRKVLVAAILRGHINY